MFYARDGYYDLLLGYVLVNLDILLEYVQWIFIDEIREK